MPADLQTVVQRMIEAGEPEENIKLVIQSYGSQPKATPPPASATIGMMQPSTMSGDPRQPRHLIDLVPPQTREEAKQYVTDAIPFMISGAPQAAIAGAKAVGAPGDLHSG